MSIVETMGKGYRYIGAHELLRWKRENGINPKAELKEINQGLRRKGKLPFLILPSRMRLVLR